MAKRESETLPVMEAAVARRLLLAGQGLLADPARPASPRETMRLIDQMGFVQIDSINVVERAHHLTLMSRLDGYRPWMLSKLLEKDRLLFEHWTHDASAIPVQWFGHWKPRFARAGKRIRANAWWRSRIGSRPGKVLREVMQRIEREGPLLAREFEHDDPEREKGAGWWSWKPQKAALEYLWRTGELAVARREGFQKVYDLTHRVYPEAAACEGPARREHVSWACETALERLGAATSTQLAAFWRSITLAEAARWCRDSIRAGSIVMVSVESADGSAPQKAFARPDWRERADALPGALERMRLLSPFDPVLRDRARARRLFGFDYTFEAFVPQAKRKYGYYVLPILEGERLVGRASLKHHRERGELAVEGLWWEPQVKATRRLQARLEAAAARLSEAIGARGVAMTLQADGCEADRSRGR